MARAKISGVTQNRIAPTKNDPPTDQGKTADQMVADTGLTPVSDPTTGETPATAVVNPSSITGTNYPIPPRYVPATAENLALAAKDGELDTTFTNQVTLRRVGGNPNLPAVYVGPRLLDENGKLQNWYGSNGESIDTEFFASSAADKATMIATAQKLGFFYGQKPSGAMLAGNGLDTSDRRAVQDLLDFSVRNGRTWRLVGGMVSSGQIAASGGGSGKMYSVVSTEDAVNSVKEEFLRVLKRMPTVAEAKQAALNIQNEERKRAQGGSMDPTSLSVASRSQAQKAAPGEYAANAAGSAVNRLFALFGGA
jgi:hypothetical protein